MMNESERKPAILIFLSANLKEDEIADILYGIEEEGIPYRISTETINSANELAYQAAQVSSLSVGIGCSRDEIVLTQRNIPQMKYVMKVKFSDSNNHKRSLGVNAARLVKGNAFKDLELMEV